MRPDGPALFFGVALLAGCGRGVFVCEDASECNAASGTGMCQPDGHCSFPDDRCPSGQRYGEHSGGVAGECVPPLDDTSASDAATSASPGETMPSDSGGSGPATTLPVDASATADDTSSSTTTSDDDDSSSSGTTGAIVDDDLLLWLPFESNRMGAFANAGTLGGEVVCLPAACPQSIDGPQGEAILLDGVDDCLSMASAPAIEGLGELTVAAWVRLDAAAEHHSFVAKPIGVGDYNSFALYRYDATPVELFVISDDTNAAIATSDIDLPMQTWFHFAGTYDGAELGVWLDGVLLGTAVNPFIGFDGQPLLIGCDDDHLESGTLGHVAGAMDDVRVYSRALTGAEIAELATP